MIKTVIFCNTPWPLNIRDGSVLDPQGHKSPDAQVSYNPPRRGSSASVGSVNLGLCSFRLVQK